jgi:hypothetical protein
MRKPLSLQLALLALWAQFWYFLIRFVIGCFFVVIAGALVLACALYFSWYFG